MKLLFTLFKKWEYFWFLVVRVIICCLSASVADFLLLSKIMFYKWKYKHAYNYGACVLLEYKSLKKRGRGHGQGTGNGDLSSGHLCVAGVVLDALIAVASSDFQRSPQRQDISAMTVLKVHVLTDESVFWGSQPLNGGKEFKSVCVTTSLIFF